MTALEKLKKEYPEAEYLDGWVYPSEGDDYPITDDKGKEVLIDNLIESHYQMEHDLACGVDSSTTIREYINHTYGSYKGAFDEA